ncbi:unnamed protein product [Effrenium voratum]|uniref:DUF7650 domain-containing protein n=1 Tax=Effrenium voratum TaxID=2562239 RepID=A0AA36IUY6_9DINO|nr:unnamed protein product [Effrenium voratum]CAJ1393987.1 unnamed protein product [Effrenium voratum]CAJ1413896.1 unnamed protein product [Effrenium voratum]
MGLPQDLNPEVEVIECSDDDCELSLTQLLEQSMEELCESQVEVPECFTPEKLKQEAALPHMQSTPTLPSAFRIPENRGRCSVLTCKRPAAELVESLDLSWEAVWPQLEAQGWRVEHGPRGASRQVYYMPPGVFRGPGRKNRIDYFDSKKLVLQLCYASMDLTSFKRQKLLL